MNPLSCSTEFGNVAPFPLQISTTEEGATANFVRGFGKTGYYLCYSMVSYKHTHIQFTLIIAININSNAII